MDREATAVQEIDYAALQALMTRVEHAIEQGLALEPEDMRLLLSAIHTLLAVQTQLEEKTITLHKLRKLLGMVRSSEKRANNVANEKDTQAKPNNKHRKKLKKPRNAK